MHKDIEMHVEKVANMKKKLADWLNEELDKGKEIVDTKEAGEVVDMIKDLAEAEKSCYEACYYKTVIEAMEEYDDDPMMGYNPNRSPRTGRYTSGRNSRMGFRPYVDPTPYIDDYIDDGEMSWGKKGDRNWRKGFHPMTDPGRDRGEDRYGREYNEYQNARRHYTETNSLEDKEAMKHHASAHVADTITTIREIWSNADPDLKKRMKSDFQALIGEMNV